MYRLEDIKLGAQVRNSAGGRCWAVDDWTRLHRFLILGSEGGSYYATARSLTVKNMAAVARCLAKDGPLAVERIVAVSVSGRAARNDHAILALALACSIDSSRAAALKAIPQVCRTGTHLFSFVKAVRGCRGMGRGLRHGIANWYRDQPAERLAYQLLKYRQRNGWTHRDVLRIAHPTPPTSAHHALFRYAVGAAPEARTVQHKGARDYPEVASLPDLVYAFQRLQSAASDASVCVQLDANPSLTWEMVPPQFLGSAKVWQSLLPNLPMTALLRNLGRLTANQALTPRSALTHQVCQRLTSRQALASAGVHPLALLIALQTYEGGVSRGALAWKPIPEVVEALNQAFYLAFDTVNPSGKRTLLALDVSGSMCAPIATLGSISCRVASVAMAMVTARTEPCYHIMAFCAQFVPLAVTPQQRLEDIARATCGLPFGNTDCALPMLWALENKVDVDTFIVYTDSETWAGNVSPVQALQRYRQQTGIAAKLVVVGMVSNGFTIADPDDQGMLDVVGFDTAAPELISAFSRDGLPNPKP